MKPMQLVNRARTFEKRNRAELLTIGAVLGLWGSMYAAYKAGPKAEKILEAKRKDLEDVAPGDRKAKRTVLWEAIRELTPVVSVPIMLGGMTTACTLGSYSVSAKKIATLSAAYTMASTALYEHKDKVKELFGEAKAQQVREAISRDHLEEAGPVSSWAAIEHTGLGDVPCFDEYTLRKFYCSAEAIGKAILRLSSDIRNEMWVSLNDFYQELNLQPCGAGEDHGWNIDHTDRGILPIYYTAILINDTPCISIQYDVELRKNFGDY